MAPCQAPPGFTFKNDEVDGMVGLLSMRLHVDKTPVD